MGAKNINRCFLPLSGMEWSLDGQMTPRNLTKRWGLVLCVGQWLTPPPFLSSFVNICVFQMSVWNESPQRKMSSVWCHTCPLRESWMQFRSYLQRLWAMIGLLRYFICSWVKVYCFLWRPGHWIEHIHQIHKSKPFASCQLDGVSKELNLAQGQIQLLPLDFWR